MTFMETVQLDKEDNAKPEYIHYFCQTGRNNSTHQDCLTEF